MAKKKDIANKKTSPLPYSIISYNLYKLLYIAEKYFLMLFYKICSITKENVV